MNSFLSIYRKIVSNLKIREEILRTTNTHYTIGPTIIWTENPDDLAIFTSNENYTHFIGFEPPFNNPRTKQYIGKILKTMRQTKGTILIKVSVSTDDATNIPIHLCGYRIDNSGVFAIFDPAWHIDDTSIYSTSGFYATLDAFKIPYVHAFPNRKHHWQSILPNDVFCQTWTLKWLYADNGRFPLPNTPREASTQLAGYIHEFVRIVQRDIPIYASLFPTYKLEGNTLDKVCRTIYRANLANILIES